MRIDKTARGKQLTANLAGYFAVRLDYLAPAIKHKIAAARKCHELRYGWLLKSPKEFAEG
jgi:hypothetical protein